MGSRSRGCAERGSARWEYAALCAAAIAGAAILAGIFAFVRFFGSPPLLFGPEDPGLVAKRASPDNAFYLLRDAASEILEIAGQYPDVKLRAIVKRDPILDMRKRTLPGVDPDMLEETIRELSEQFKDPQFDFEDMRAVLAESEETEKVDDPDLLAYLKDAAPAVETMRQAMKQPYYLLPSVEDQATFDSLLPYQWGVGRLSGVLAVQARIHHLNEMGERAVGLGVELVDLGIMVASDGPLAYRDRGCAVQTDGCYAISDSINQCDDADVLEGLLDQLEAIDEKDAPWDGTVECEFRFTERFSLVTPPPYPGSARSEEAQEVLESLQELSRIGIVENRRRRAIQKYIRDYRKMYPSGCEKPYGLAKGLPKLDNTGPLHFVFMFTFSDLNMSRFRQAECATFRHATLANIALRIWRLRNGSYPDSLAELVPELLPEIPLYDGTTRPLEYYRVEEHDWYVLRNDVTEEDYTPWKTG